MAKASASVFKASACCLVQGREKDVVLFSTVRAQSSARIGFVADERRINVGLTRAQASLLVVGNAEALGKDARWGSFMQMALHSRWGLLEIRAAIERLQMRCQTVAERAQCTIYECAGVRQRTCNGLVCVDNYPNAGRLAAWGGHSRRVHVTWYRCMYQPQEPTGAWVNDAVAGKVQPVSAPSPSPVCMCLIPCHGVSIQLRTGSIKLCFTALKGHGLTPKST